MIHYANEYRMGLDYLATRDDIDMEKIGHIGFSWGSASFGVILAAIEERYKSIIFIGAGLHPNFRPFLPEANLVNFAPYIEAPKLILHGAYDEEFSYRLHALPLYDLLREPKRIEKVEGGHMPSMEVRVPIINQWLDETLGPVKFD